MFNIKTLNSQKKMFHVKQKFEFSVEKYIFFGSTKNFSHEFYHD
jgi:hypothetical protein